MTKSSHDWHPPACTGWTSDGFSSMVTTTARFRAPSGAELLRRIGAISQLAGTRYWSTTHQRWQTLIVEAHALVRQSGRRREDFSTDELSRGGQFYFEQEDNLSGKAVYRMNIREVSERRIVFGVENASTVKYLLIPVFHPGDLQTIYFLDRDTGDVWKYCGVMRTGNNASGLATGKLASAMNRALALFRRFAGVPTDREPPAAK